jgi:hypothetical protein
MDGAEKSPLDIRSQALLLSLGLLWIACPPLASCQRKRLPKPQTTRTSLISQIDWLLGSGCGLQSHGMCPGENHSSHTRPDSSSAHRGG